MHTPFDWQEGIGNRAQYIESKLSQGAAVLALSIQEGILLYTRRRQSRKLFEVYDRIGLGALGQQADLESVRTAAVEFAHREGYQRSEHDVTVQRVAAALSTPMKKAFSDFGTAPLIARALFAEIGDKVDLDTYYALDYDGDFEVSRRCASIAGTIERAQGAQKALKGLKATLTLKDALDRVTKIWEDHAPAPQESGEDEWIPEALLIERRPQREDRFRELFPEAF